MIADLVLIALVTGNIIGFFLRRKKLRELESKIQSLTSAQNLLETQTRIQINKILLKSAQYAPAADSPPSPVASPSADLSEQSPSSTVTVVGPSPVDKPQAARRTRKDDHIQGPVTDESRSNARCIGDQAMGENCHRRTKTAETSSEASKPVTVAIESHSIDHLHVSADENPDGHDYPARLKIDREQSAGTSKITPTPSETNPIPASRPPAENKIPRPPMRLDWESFIGVRLFSVIAAVALLIGAVGFLRYSLQHGWLGPSVRTAIGILFGTLLIAASETRAAQRYGITTRAMTAVGIATLFSSIYASHALWRLIESPVVTFILLALVAGVGVALSIRRNSLFIAVLGLLGGFVTPILLSSGQDRSIGLFGYLLILNICLAWVAYKKRWPSLSVCSLIFTGFYQMGWVFKHFNADRIPLAMGIFLVFPLIGIGSFLINRGHGSNKDAPSLFHRTALFATIPPILFAMYMAITPECGEHYGLLFSFLFVIALGLALVAAFVGPEWIHILGGGVVLFVMFTFLGRAYSSSAWPAFMFIVGLFALLFLTVPWLVRKLGKPFVSTGNLATFTSALILLVYPFVAGIEPGAENPLVLFGSLLVLVLGIAVYAVITNNGGIHLLASISVILTEIVWSIRYLDQDHLLSALLIYGGFGLLFFAAPLLAEKRGKPWPPIAGGSLLLFTSLWLLFFLSIGPIAKTSLAVIAVLMGLFNIGLFYEASRGRHPILAWAGVILSWIVMASWWINTKELITNHVGGLCVLAGFALLVTWGSLWVRNQAAKANLTKVSNTAYQGSFLGLTGHLFILVLVNHPLLSSSYWAWLATLAVLDLAIGVPALALRRGALHISAVLSTGIILLTWSAPYRSYYPPILIPIGAAVMLAAFALTWTFFAQRRNVSSPIFTLAAQVVIFLCLLVVSSSILQYSFQGSWLAPATALLLLLAALLFLEWKTGQYGWSIAGAAAFSLGSWVYLTSPGHDWKGLLGISLPIYLALLAYPLVLSLRVRNQRAPFIASLVGSMFFFLFGRQVLIQAGAENVMGLLPVTQAVLLLPLLWVLLRIEPASKRDIGRLALIAGGILALVTAAIPLQLEKQWITLGWALQGAALAWLYRRLNHKGLLYWLAALFAAVFVRLTINPQIFDYYTHSHFPILNWYLYTWLTAAGSFFAAAILLRSTYDRLFEKCPRLSHILKTAGIVLLFELLNIEIADFYSTEETISFSFSAGLAQNLTYTISWAVFAIGLLAAGVITHSRLTRITSIALMGITVLKAFLYDLSELKELYRVASFVGLAFCLVLVAIVLQRFVLQDKHEKKDQNATHPGNPGNQD